jgi:EAL domain-containing protein (putative c-di-GMP-specific phosphodiesterase class I)
VYVPDLDTNSPRRLTLVSELRNALQTGGVAVHVQPQGLLSTGRVVGVEALVRWNHPDMGPISPDEFVPIAERSGLIGQLTARILDASLAACADWRASGHDLGDRRQPLRPMPTGELVSWLAARESAPARGGLRVV